MLYNSFAELYSHYENKYGEINRGYFTEEEQRDWLTACCELYPVEFGLRDTFKSSDGDYEKYDGMRFEIIEPANYYEADEVYEESCPMFGIRFVDTGEEIIAYAWEVCKED